MSIPPAGHVVAPLLLGLAIAGCQRLNLNDSPGLNTQNFSVADPLPDEAPRKSALAEPSPPEELFEVEPMPTARVDKPKFLPPE